MNNNQKDVKDLIVRGERETDRRDVYEINSASFETKAEADLVDALRKSKAYVRGLSLVAVEENKVLGHAIFTRAFIVNRGKRFKCLALGPMAVLPEKRRTGIGGKLIEEGFERGRELGYSAVVVMGHKDYYPKFGFKPASEMRIKTPYNWPEENFMVAELANNSLKNISGVVEYAREFKLVTPKPKEKAEMPVVPEIIEDPIPENQTLEVKNAEVKTSEGKNAEGKNAEDEKTGA